MVSSKTFRQLALACPETVELPHFEKTSFRVNKKIFATLSEEKNLGMIILTPEEQYVYCKFDPLSFSPVPGKWGLKGCTHVNLKKVNKDVLKEAMDAAYEGKLSKKSK
jgi:hypothetical protein